MNLIKSIESPSEVRRTGHLAHFVYFLSLRPLEVQRKSAGLASPASPMIFCFKVTSPDFHRTWTGQAAEFGQVRRNPLEVRWTVRWVRWNWLGPVKVRRNPSEKGGECKVHLKTHNLAPKSLPITPKVLPITYSHYQSPTFITNHPTFITNHSISITNPYYQSPPMLTNLLFYLVIAEPL